VKRQKGKGVKPTRQLNAWNKRREAETSGPKAKYGNGEII